MGRPKHPKPAKLFVGFITNEILLINEANAVLIKKFGEVDSQSKLFNFHFTSYYNKEFGTGLKRKFLTFKRLISLENISAVKHMTNRLEAKFSVQGRRRINIDPGYICLGKLALLTTKDYYHRVYIGKGIYAEVALYYREKSFRHFDWSYPDYKSEASINFFNKARDIYYSQLRPLQNPSSGRSHPEESAEGGRRGILPTC